MPSAPLPLGGGRFAVPGNRWDRLDGVEPAAPPTVCVVIPYFEAQARLDLVLAAVSDQAYPVGRLDVIVADDGSARPPRLTHSRWPTRTVRQHDGGFRAAAARNLAAAESTSDVLVFLDDDTIPERDYIRRLVRLPALLPDALVTGRRRHADFRGWTPAMVSEWARGERPPPPELTEPAWLAAEHRRSGDLLDVGPESYRYVISAVMACSRALFTELGGFDETMVGYGGEDWDLAHRAVCAGAVLAHVPSAVAWHDGPDWAERGTAESRRHEKNAETVALARRIPESRLLPTVWTGRPNVVVELDVGDADAAAVLVTVRSVLGAPTSCGVWLLGGDAQTLQQDEFGSDPRVGAGPPPRHATDSARVLLRVRRPVRFGAAFWPWLLAELTAGPGPGRVTVVLGRDGGDPAVTAVATRAQRRAARWTSAAPGQDLVARLFGAGLVDGADVGVTALPRHPDLAHELTREPALGDRICECPQPVRRS